MNIRSGQELLEICNNQEKKIYQIAIQQEMKNSNLSVEQIKEQMMKYWQVMKESVEKGMAKDTIYKGKIIGGEAPCSKWNAIGAANALIVAEMALSEITSVVPFDEVVIAMQSVGNMMPCSLRETAQGGIATTPTGIKIRREIFGE